MAFQVGSSCYGEPVAAVQAMAANVVGSVVVHGGSAYVVNAAAADADSISYSLQPLSGGSAISTVVQVTPQPCGLLDWQDGLTLGWGIAAAWIACAALLVLRRGAHE